MLGLLTSRTGGVSTGPYASLNLSRSVGDDPAAVRQNRELLAAACGVPVPAMAWMHQVHGREVLRIAPDELPMDVLPRCDATFTDVPGTALVVLAADCAPVLLADPAARVIGAAHAGREGMAAGVVPALVAAMTTAGAKAGRMTAMIGPAICGGCYEVPGSLRDRVAAAEPAAACVTRSGTPGLDIRAGLRAQLGRLGLHRVSSDPRCTAQSAELFSYRRDGRTGRFGALVWLTA